MSTNKEYDNWSEGEKYLESVVQKMSPPGGFKRSIKIKLVRDPSVNASAYEDGYIYINVGLFNNISTEAELASVLAHEIGHVTLHHNYSRFKANYNYANAKSIGTVIGGLTGFVIRRMARANLSEHSVSDEEDADEYAIQLIKTSGYSPLEMIKLFEGFQRQSELLDSRIVFNKHKKYFKTHPSNKSRINHIKKSLQVNSLTGKNFSVDSIYFMKLKRQCIDESLYLLFSRLQFEDCIELAYRQHLDYPTDNFYLFFLENSLTRLLKENPALGNKRFITNRYVINNISKIQSPKKSYSKFYKNKPAEFVYRQSIFYNLSAIYYISDSDLNNLSNQTLVNNDTLEFINNEDALEYFQKVGKENNCNICPLYSSTATRETYIENSDNDLENHLYSLHNGLNKYLNNYDNYYKKIFMISRFDEFYVTNFDFGKSTQENINNIYSLLQSDNILNEQYVLPQNLKFNERADLLEYLDKIQNYLPDPTESSTSKLKVLNKKYFNCLEIFPELGTILSNNKSDKINFLSISKVQLNTGGYMNLLIQVYDYIINCYSIDLKNNTICKYTENIGEANDKEILNNAVKAFKEMNRLIVKNTQ